MQSLSAVSVTITFAVAAAMPSASHAENKAEAIDAALHRLFPPNLPGAAVLVLEDGATLLNKGYGLANVELDVPMQPGDVFNAASVGKQFTAAAIMKLAEDGKLTVQTPIRRYFPTIPAAWDGITVEHLLHHTSGIANIFTDAQFRQHAYEKHTPQQMLAQAIAMPLLAPPGTKFNYSSVNYTLLAIIIEKLSGATYEAYLARQFFMPLGMKQTYFVEHAGLVKGLVTPYEKGPRLAVRWDNSLLFGGGSYATTNADLARWTLALQGGQVLKPASLKAMTTPLVLANGASVPYGYGLRPHTLAGQVYLRSSGDIQGFHAEVVYMPASKVLVSILSNGEDAPAFGLLRAARRVATIAAGMPSHPVVRVPLPDSALQQRAGIYRNGDDRYAFHVKDGRLMVEYPAGATWKPLPLSPDEFYYEANSDFRIRFFTTADGRPASQWREMDPLDDETDPVFMKE